MAQPEPFPGALRRNIVGMEWETEFIPHMRQLFTPGKHGALIGPTGEGKTNLAAQLLAALRKWVLALDPKGEDETLTKSGFERIDWWPLEQKQRGKKIRDEIAEGKPARLIIGGAVRSKEEMQKLSDLMRSAVEGVRAEGGWTIYVDEFQIAADRRMFGLDKEIEALLIAARSRGTSVLTSFQAPAWVPKAGTRQAEFVVMWPTRDRVMIKTVAEAMGREWHDLAEAVDALEPFHVLVIPKRVRDPMVLTHPPKLS